MKHILKKGEISELISDSGAGGLTREKRLVSHEGKRYVLRICKDIKTAERYEKIHKKLEKYSFLPKLIGRQRRKILFEYIRGRDCRHKDALKVAYDVGRIVGAVSKLPLNLPHTEHHHISHNL